MIAERKYHKSTGSDITINFHSAGEEKVSKSIIEWRVEIQTVYDKMQTTHQQYENFEWQKNETNNNWKNLR